MRLVNLTDYTIYDILKHDIRPKVELQWIFMMKCQVLIFRNPEPVVIYRPLYLGYHTKMVTGLPIRQMSPISNRRNRLTVI